MLAGFAAAGAGQHSRIGRNRPFQGTVVAVEGLCNIRSPDDKDTIRVEIDLGDSGLEYTPGDALGTYASNAPAVGCTPVCCSMQKNVAAENIK